MSINNVCVYCGSSPGNSPIYMHAARELGQEISRRKMTLIYGGSSVGLMGEVARAAQAGGSRVVGVIPKALADQEIAFFELCELKVVDSMHERKALMAELSDAFVTMPGGFGTLEEFFEILTWTQLGLHVKPSGLLNINGYFNQLLSFLEYVSNQHFVHHSHIEMIQISTEPSQLLEKLATYQPQQGNKIEWVHAMDKKHRLQR